MSIILFYNLLFTILASSFLGFYLGRRNVQFIAIGSLSLSFFCACFLVYEVFFCMQVCSTYLYNWLTIGINVVDLGLYFDGLTVLMVFIIASISTLVHIYSVGYLAEDPSLIRFLFFLSFFTFFMIFMVTAPNFLQLFLGWEGVGLCSYLLINFWYTRLLANRAALKAMIMNRISDVIFILGIVLLFNIFHNTDYHLVFTVLESYVQLNSHKIIFAGISWNFADLACLLLVAGSIGKSAQLGLHTWLPDAMEGPTPVSSLLHAATMVTAGVFLILRCSALFEMSPLVLKFISIIGSLTCVFAGLSAMGQHDIKKVIAYSTCSQLGYMFFACGLSGYNIAFFHLYNHAFFKALLFLSAGSVIHALGDEQDMRRMGGLTITMPVTYVAFWIGSLAIMGFPFLAGFYSKDLILELAFSRVLVNGYFIYFMGSLGALCTSIYSLRLMHAVFFVNSNSSRIIMQNAHESTGPMFFSIYTLAFLTLIVGYVAQDLLTGLGNPLWNQNLQTLPSNINLFEAHALPPLVKNGTFLVTVFIAYFVTTYEPRPHNFVSSFLYHAGYVNEMYNALFLVIFKNSYEYLNKILDKGFFELPQVFYSLSRWVKGQIQKSTSHLIFFYVFYMFLAMQLAYVLLINPYVLPLVVCFLISLTLESTD